MASDFQINELRTRLDNIDKDVYFLKEVVSDSIREINTLVSIGKAMVTVFEKAHIINSDEFEKLVTSFHTSFIKDVAADIEKTSDTLAKFQREFDKFMEMEAGPIKAEA